MRTVLSLVVFMLISGVSLALGFDSVHTEADGSHRIFEASDRPGAEWGVVNPFSGDVSWTFADPHILDVDWGFANPRILDVDWGFADPNPISAAWFVQNPGPAGQVQFPPFSSSPTKSLKGSPGRY